MKAGGPNYVATLCRWADDEAVPVEDVRSAYRRWWAEVGTQEQDATGLAAERNGFRYRPLPGGVAVRFGAGATDRQRALVSLASEVTGCRLVVSDSATESASAFADRIAALGVDRVRSIRDADPDDLLAIACHATDVVFDDSSPVGAAEIELPRWLREQSLTVTTHRHGRINAPE